MNDLTKEARARAYEAMNRDQQMNSNALQNLGMASAHHGDALANANAGPKYGDKSLNPVRPLTGEPEHYLTGYEGSRCDRIDVPHETTHGFDIETYSDGYSEGVAAGMTLMEPNMEESRTGINLDKINRVSDEYRRISDEVEQEIGE